MENNNHTDFEVELENLTCDLLSESQHESFLHALFALPKAAWGLAHDLFPSRVKPKLKAVEMNLEGDLRVTWLDYPGAQPGDGAALVVFFLDSSYWSKAAFFNRNSLSPPVKKPRKLSTSR